MHACSIHSVRAAMLGAALAPIALLSCGGAANAADPPRVTELRNQILTDAAERKHP